MRLNLFAFLSFTTIVSCNWKTESKDKLITIAFSEALSVRDFYPTIAKIDSMSFVQKRKADSIASEQIRVDLEKKLKASGTTDSQNTTDSAEQIYYENENGEIIHVGDEPKELDIPILKEDNHSHPFLSLFTPNFIHGNYGRTYLAESAFIGFSDSKDTSIVSKYFNNSNIVTKKIKMFWMPLGFQSSKSELCAKKRNAKITTLINSNIASICISKKDSGKSMFQICYESLLNKSEYRMTLKLTENGQKVISGMENKPLLISFELAKKKYFVSTTPEKIIISGIIAGDIGQSLKDSIGLYYPHLVNEK